MAMETEFDPRRAPAGAPPLPASGGAGGTWQRPVIALAAVNFCIADISGGLGPYLATWLAGMAGWTPMAIGVLMTVVKLVPLGLATPVGVLVDRTGRPRLLAALACLAILGGALALLFLRHFWAILASQVVVFSGGTLAGPAIMALTLGVVGRQGFARQFGVNEATAHAGNMVAAGLIVLLSAWLGGGAPFLVLAAMGCCTLGGIFAIPRRAIDMELARGRQAPGHGGLRDFRVLLGDRRLLMVLAAITLFNFGNDQMLPLLGQRLAHAAPALSAGWLAGWILVAQATMIPVALLAGRLAGRRGMLLLLLACLVLAGRALLAATVVDVRWVMAVEVLDGLGAGLISVAGPVAIVAITYGSGRTQTAMGVANSLAGLAAAGSALGTGVLAQHFGWQAALAAMAVPPLLAVPLLLGVILRRPAARLVTEKRRSLAGGQALPLPQTRA